MAAHIDKYPDGLVSGGPFFVPRQDLKLTPG
jgi:hypothetical protein